MRQRNTMLKCSESRTKELENYTEGLIAIDPQQDRPFIHAIRSKLGLSAMKQTFTDYPFKSIEMFFISVYKEGAILQLPFLRVTINNQTKRFYTFANHTIVTRWQTFLLIHKGHAELTFYDLTRPILNSTLDWKKITKQQLYRTADSWTDDFYSTAHKTMTETLRERISSLGDAVLLISVACGDGKEFHELIKLKDQKSLYIAGFDINEQNIEQAVASFPQGYFFPGIIEQLESNIMKIKAWCHAQINKPFDTIIIFSGILQRTMLSGSFEAARYLQITHQHANLVLIAGLLVPLVNRHICKKIGYDCQIKLIDFKLQQPHQNSVYVLTPSSKSQRLAFLTHVSNKRSPKQLQDNIDVSLSASLLKDISLFDTSRLRQTRQIDLSWADIPHDDVKRLIDFLVAHMPALKVVLIATYEQWASRLQSHLKNSLTGVSLFQRNDQLNAHEVPHLSVNKARFFNLYDEGKLPVTFIAKTAGNKSVTPKMG